MRPVDLLLMLLRVIKKIGGELGLNWCRIQVTRSDGVINHK
jgi:hypothetical protein